MLRIALFLIILLVALGYALKKGGTPEKMMAAILIAMLVSDQALHLFVPVQFATIDTGHLVIDFGAAAATIALAMVAYRFWPMVAAMLQTLPLLGHLSRAMEMSMHPIAYLTMQVAASWLLPPLLVLATWRHQQRLRLRGSDPSWHLSSRRSSPPKAAS